MSSPPSMSEDAARPVARLLAGDSPALVLAARFRAAGHQLFLVGGPVRDLVLKRPHFDLDFATDALPEQTVEVVRPLAKNVWTHGAEFGTVGAEIAETRMEITTFRTEKYRPASRHPEVKFEPDIVADLSRRDFRINAMAISLPDLDRVDPFGGLADIQARILRTPIEPDASFSDDPLRMLRAFRFASQLDFEIAREVLDAISRLKDLLTTVSAERIRDELEKLMLGDAPARALELADKTSITDLFLPELRDLKLEQDPVHRHKDVFHHTLAVVERAAERDPERSLDLRLAALLHDIGKPRTRRITEEGVTFHHHEVVGAEMAAKRLRALRFPNDVSGRVVELIRLHHRFHTYRLGWSDSAVRRYVRDAGPLLGVLNALVRADCTTRNPARAKRLALRMDELERRISELARKEEIESIRPDLDGFQVMAYLGVDGGPLVGRALSHMLEVRMDEGPLPEQDAYRRLDEWARAEGITPAGEKVPPRPRKQKARE